MVFLIQDGAKYDLSPFYSKKEQAFLIKPDVPGDISLMIGGGYVGLEVSLISLTVYGVSGISPQKT